MPFFNEFFLEGLTQSFCFLQVLGLHPFVFDKLNRRFQCKLGSAITILHMNMNGIMLIGIEKESQSKDIKYCRHNKYRFVQQS